MEVSELTVDVLRLVNLYIHLLTTVREGLTVFLIQHTFPRLHPYFCCQPGDCCRDHIAGLTSNLSHNDLFFVFAVDHKDLHFVPWIFDNTINRYKSLKHS